MSDRKFANTLARGLSVLRAFRVSDVGLTRTELVARTGLAPATITRLTHTLIELGYLGQNGNLLRLGPAALALASVTNASSSFLDVANGAMQQLAEQTKTLVLLAVPDGNSMTFVRTWRPRDVASIWLEPGNRVPIAHSSTGQAFLAGLSTERFAAKKPSEEWQRLRTAGRAQLAAQGFTFVRMADHYTDTLNATAHPYYASELGEPVVFTCGAAPEMLSAERVICEVGPALKKVVRELEQKTGAPRTYDQNV